MLLIMCFGLMYKVHACQESWIFNNQINSLDAPVRESSISIDTEFAKTACKEIAIALIRNLNIEKNNGWRVSFGPKYVEPVNTVVVVSQPTNNLLHYERVNMRAQRALQRAMEIEDMRLKAALLHYNYRNNPLLYRSYRKKNPFCTITIN